MEEENGEILALKQSFVEAKEAFSGQQQVVELLMQRIQEQEAKLLEQAAAQKTLQATTDSNRDFDSIKPMDRVAARRATQLKDVGQAIMIASILVKDPDTKAEGLSKLDEATRLIKLQLCCLGMTDYHSWDVINTYFNSLEAEAKKPSEKFADMDFLQVSTKYLNKANNMAIALRKPPTPPVNANPNRRTWDHSGSSGYGSGSTFRGSGGGGRSGGSYSNNAGRGRGEQPPK
jgi:hypothetical protein